MPPSAFHPDHGERRSVPLARAVGADHAAVQVHQVADDGPPEAKPGASQVWGVNARRTVCWKNEESFIKAMLPNQGSVIFQSSPATRAT